ncbi:MULTISPECIES: S-ribosylhomocysteine lyase [unclassified Thermoanaerobacterium]|jgi:S-ribosylhomocysteine lyase|uniref:S-ribosylhomocysteine lyase n=1 Tax=Thermoanaerobacterium TaxID=28895 RepID=UPI000A1509CB|nr:MULTISPECIES: S-ribosylhomocysteine lyase [unclassified Thermoanaerobacterium]MDE4542445.1 S-ribosylhomocysteine lyase [Thermoanaerobacterium sp. R66]ORX24439.1 S-ribosylhomocysteine lyase [Thermoanaerobacterium sp. PSU-2]HHV73874.1 S-ribosylhomocysteine lyase [Thermoanaerobacterium sp.]
MEIKVESFKLDHRTVKAPYVRKSGTLVGPNGDVVTKYDIRLTQPNVDSIPTGGIHTLEHLFATYFRDYFDDIIDISPMGCRTGFYLTKFGDTSIDEIKDALRKVLERVLTTKEEDVPATNEIQCGNYRDHSLFTAKEYAKAVLEKL